MSTFLGLPAAAPGDPADVAILGVTRGVDYPDVPPACADGPAAIRRRSQRLAPFADHWDFDLDGPMLPAGLRVVDCGDVEGAEAAERAVREIVAAGAVPILLGGDDSIPIPMLRGLAAHPSAGAASRVAVLQLDAHLDFRDEVSGVCDGYSSSMRRASEMPHLGPIVQVGLRGVGSARPGDVEAARTAGNRLVTARELRARGVDAAVEMLSDGGAPLAVCLDLDGLDPSVAPGVRAAAPGGLGYEEACSLLAAALDRSPLAAAAITELAPALDPQGLTALTAVRLVVHLLAGVARQQR